MAVFATYLINYTIPRAGEVARASIITNYEGVPFEKGLWNNRSRTYCRFDSNAWNNQQSHFFFNSILFMPFLIEKFNPTKNFNCALVAGIVC